MILDWSLCICYSSNADTFALCLRRSGTKLVRSTAKAYLRTELTVFAKVSGIVKCRRQRQGLLVEIVQNARCINKMTFAFAWNLWERK